MRAFLLTLFFFVTALEFVLALLNLRHMRRQRDIPAALVREIDAATLDKARSYAEDRARFSLVSLCISRALLAWVLFGGVLASFDARVSALALSLVVRNVVFFLGCALVVALFSIPFSLYERFVVEARHGFNRMSRALWFADFAKGTLLSLGFVAALSAGATRLVESSPSHWWVWIWLLSLVFSILLTLIAPRVIEPLFFKVTPLAAQSLEESIQRLAERAGVEVKRVFQVDASRRSAHSNAYFTGIGPVKRVVLFDTLLRQMEPREVLAIVAHELGHWKLHHVLKRFAVGQLISFGACYAAFMALNSAHVPGWVGASHGSLAFSALVVAFAGWLLESLASPLFSYWSRRDERAADRFAAELTSDPSALVSGLKKLARENLSNLFPHPLVSAIYASHPTLLERVETLEDLTGTT